MFPRAALTVAALVCLAANLRAEPRLIVEIETGFLLGAVDGKKWIPAEKARALVKGGETYSLYGLGRRLSSCEGRLPTSAGAPCDETQVIRLIPKPTSGVLAITGEGFLLPRYPQRFTTIWPAYKKAVAEYLVGKGLRAPEVKITQVFHIDLEGDGEEEVLISGTNYLQQDDRIPSGAPAGSYSFVLLRRVVRGKVLTQTIAGDFYPKAKDFNAPVRWSIGGTFDVDGDGTLEVLLHGVYYEGGWTTLYRCGVKKIEELLTVGCGA